MTFDDGILKVYEVTNSASPGDMPIAALSEVGAFYFHEDSLGVTRYFEAIKAGQLIERVVSIPYPAFVSINHVVAFEDGSQFQVRMVQPERDEQNLKILRLSLERAGEQYEIVD